MADSPASPIEKLYAYRTQAVALGKEYDENKIRAYINETFRENNGAENDVLPLVADPEVIEENAARKRAIRLEDREAAQQLKDAVAKATEASAKQQSKDNEAALLRARVERQEQELRELRAQMGAREGQSAALPAAAGSEQTIRTESGQPTEAWTVRQIREWGAERGIAYPQKPGGAFPKKLELLEYILDEAAKAEEGAE